MAYYNRGTRYAALGQHERAIENYEAAIKFNPEYSAAYSNQGISYAALGLHERAIEDYDAAIEFDPEYSARYNNRDKSYAALGLHERAIEDYDAAIKLNPEDAAAYYNKACCYALQRMVSDAVYWLSQALEMDRYRFCNLVREDSDFEAIRDDEEFKKLMMSVCWQE